MPALRWCLPLLAVCLSAGSHAQLTQEEKQGTADALYIGNFRLADLQFERKPFRDPLRLPLIDKSIDDPLGTTDFLLGFHASSKSASAQTLLRSVVEGMFGGTLAPLPEGPSADGLSELPPELRKTLLSLVAWIGRADAEVRAATRTLTPEEMRELVEGLPVWAVEEPKVTFDFVRRPFSSQARMLELLAKVDLARIRSASVELLGAAERAAGTLKASRESLEGKLKVRVAGMPVVIGGTGDTLHDDTDARLTIDLGGNDTYVGRHGAGVGYSGVLIDVSGDDQYDVRDLSAGAAILGIGMALDMGGKDTFRGRSLCFGAGLAGVGVFSKIGGNDLYESTSLSQGFGQFGVGILSDTGGDDVYRLKLMGQGAARTQGVGWLVDRAGSDQYRAGGLALNSPLFADAHYSFAQGFGMGFREDTGGVSGGIGLLTDHGGDDFYLGETYQQAASYWFSLGTLYDAAGNDTYTGHHYCQSSAMHMTSAYLFDLAGHDAYAVKVGAAHAIGHDYGVAVLLDRAGDDLYASRDSTPGIGNANGLGLFVDSDGIDRYHGPPGRGNAARGSGSLGVFVDLNGTDLYRFGLADGQGSATEAWGFAYDAETRIADVPGSSGRPPVTPGSQQMPPTGEMVTIYRRATQWGVGTAQEEVLANLDRLVAIGTPALDWMLENRLAGADRLQIRAFVHVVRTLGQDGATALGRRALAGNAADMRPILLIAIDADVRDIGAILPSLLERADIQALAIRAAGALKATAAVPTLMRLCLSDDRLVSRAAIVSLNQIGDVAAYGTAQAMFGSADPLSRKAAAALMAQFPAQAVQTGMAMAQDAAESRARQGIELLGAVGTPQALAAIGGMLTDPRPGVRIECLIRLAGRCPAEFRVALLALRKDPVATVRAVANRTEPGA